MKQLLLILALFSTSIAADHPYRSNRPVHQTRWCVIGDGPAGIMAACRLIDLGAAPQDIRWIGTKFNAGRFGEYYLDIQLISHNAYNAQYFTASEFMKLSIPTYINNLYAEPAKVPCVHEVVDPLLEVTNKLFEAGVQGIKDTARLLFRENNTWCIGTDQCVVYAENLILALGWKPRRMLINVGVEIPLDYAMSANTLRPFVTPGETVALFGDGNSARLVVNALRECGIDSIVNVVPERHLGLQGISKVVQLSERELLEQELIRCSKLIYAIGFERNTIEVTAAPYQKLAESQHSFVIEDGLIQVSHMDLRALAIFARDILPQAMVNGAIRKQQ